MEKITVIDSMMGSGKTSFAIEYMNKNYDDNVLYITPYLNETTRINNGTIKEMKSPKNLGNGKLNNILELLQNQEDISSTHALFLKLNSDCKELLSRGIIRYFWMKQ